MPRPLVYLIYNLLLPFVLIVGFPAFVVKGLRRGGLARNFRQRLGVFRSSDLFEPSEAKESPLWIHAVSVGEVFLALKVVEAIQKGSPKQRIILSVTTTTGFAVAREHTSETIRVIHNPIDLPWITASTIQKIRPRALVLIEAEVWPNLVAQLVRKEIPVVLANARLSPRSASRYARFRSLVEPIFSQLRAVSVPFPSDVSRWEAIGIPESKVQVLGSVKFDSTIEAGNPKEQELRNWLAEEGCPKDARILLGGSTHEGEERLLAQSFLELKKRVPDLALVIVPRHAERARSIVSQLEEMEFQPITRIPLGEQAHTPSASASEQRVWIANTTGELRSWFSLSEVVVIGKSFCGEGGQNPVEPILAGKPVVVGPHMENFEDVVRDLRNNEGILQLSNQDELTNSLEELFLNPGKGSALATRGRKTMEQHEGASARTAAFIFEQVEGTAS